METCIETNAWQVLAMFDYDDYYQAVRDVKVDGKFAFERKGRRYRNEAEAQTYVNKLNTGEAS